MCSTPGSCLAYEPPIHSCCECSTPTTGVMCLSCTTRFQVGGPR